MEKIYEESKDVHANYLVYANENGKLFANKEFTEYLDKDEFIRAFKSNEIVVGSMSLGSTEPTSFTKVIAVDNNEVNDCYCAMGTRLLIFNIATKPEEESGSEDEGDDDQ